MTKKEQGRKTGSSRKRTKFAEIRRLNCFPKLEEKLAQGYPLAEIARWVQEEQEEYCHVTRDSLTVMLGRYRKDMASTQLIAPRMPDVVLEAKGKVENGLQELDELENLYKTQLERIRMGHDLEKKLKILNKSLSTEIGTAMNLLKSRHDIKMDLGLSGGRDLGTLTVQPQIMLDVKSKYGDEVFDAISSPESRGKVLSLVNRIASVSGAEDQP